MERTFNMIENLFVWYLHCSHHMYIGFIIIPLMVRHALTNNAMRFDQCQAEVQPWFNQSSYPEINCGFGFVSGLSLLKVKTVNKISNWYLITVTIERKLPMLFYESYSCINFLSIVSVLHNHITLLFADSFKWYYIVRTQ